MDVKIEESWKKRLADEFEKDYFKQLTDFVKQEYRQGTVYPPGPYKFNAFEHCQFDKVKVVILGQDPYHEPGQAHVGLELLNMVLFISRYIIKYYSKISPVLRGNS